MFAPPKRYGRPARSRRGPERVTNEPEGLRLVPAAPDPATSAAVARRHAQSEATRIRASSGTVRSRGRGDSSSRRRAAAAAVLVAAAVPASGTVASATRIPGISFADRGAGQLVVTATAYRLTLSKKNGKILDLVDRASGTHLLRQTTRCLWGAISYRDISYIGGCSFAQRGARRFSYRWDPASATLELDYRARTFGSVVVTLRARAAFFDLRMTLENRGAVRTRIPFPEGLAGDVGKVTAGYAPNVLPGVRLKPAFFARVGNNVEIYPSRWAFADYLALDVGRAHLSLYSVAPGPIHPIQLGFLHRTAPSPCSDRSFCIVHEFQTWVTRGKGWTSPVVRVRIDK